MTGVVPESGIPLHVAAAVESAPFRLEGRDIVTGRARYPADVRLPGMLRGHALHPPKQGARLATLEDRAARGCDGSH